jgi:hypothetical protein
MRPPNLHLRELNKEEVDEHNKQFQQDMDKGIKILSFYLSCIDCGAFVSKYLYKEAENYYESPARLVTLYPESTIYYIRRIGHSRLSVQEKSRLCEEARLCYNIAAFGNQKIA